MNSGLFDDQPVAIKVEVYPKEDSVLANEILMLIDLNSGNEEDMLKFGWPKIYDHFQDAFLISHACSDTEEVEETKDNSKINEKDTNKKKLPCKALVETLMQNTFWNKRSEPNFYTDDNILNFIERMVF